MAEPFKELLNPSVVKAAAAALHRASPGFEHRRFERLATAGLGALEMKARAEHIGAALEATLPADFGAAADAIEAALAPPLPDDRLNAPADGSDGLRGWILWPVGEFVARRGLQDPERALRTLHALTQRFTAEFAIRPFIVEHPALVFDTLARWCDDPSPHVRRLVSEGSRPRLPWGLRLRALVADPSPTLPLLRALQDDPSAYVRRSVANHLNDIGKDHPAVVAAWLEEHLPRANAERSALLRHASRSLVKRGDAAVLQAWGIGAAYDGTVQLSLGAESLRIGDALPFTLTLRSRAPAAQRLAIDYVLHHRKADGSRTPKVFKGWTLTLPAGGVATLSKRHPMRVVTVRRYHPGLHALAVQINGRPVAQADFMLHAGAA